MFYIVLQIDCGSGGGLVSFFFLEITDWSVAGCARNAWFPRAMSNCGAPCDGVFVVSWRQCITKQLFDSFFVISEIIMVFSNVIILSLRSWLVSFTLTLIVQNITKPHPSTVYCLVLLSPFKCLRNQVATQPKETTGSGDENGFFTQLNLRKARPKAFCREVCILVRYKLSWVALGTRMKKSPFVYEEVRSRCTRGNMGRRCLLTLSSSHSPLCVGCCANSLKSRQATIVKDSSTCRLMFDNKIRSSLKFELILII